LDTFRELLAKQIGVQPRQIGSSRFSTRAGDVLLEGLNKHPDARIEGVSDAMAAGMWRAALVAGQNSPKEYNAPSR
jgi:vancomycin permeability regulator SanA